MPSNGPPSRWARGRLALATLALVIGFAMVIIGVLPYGSIELADVAFTARPAAAGASEPPGPRALPRQVPWSAGSWSGGLQKAGERHETPRQIATPNGDPGAMRAYLLRGAAAARRGNWDGEASAPDFS